MPSTSVQPVDLNKLPSHLSERVRVIQKAPIGTDGHFVLYWMHHAIRSHENPALDTALSTAGQLHLPVLVYQGLGGRHPFNSDRHHTFIMEGAREVQQHLQDRGISHAFYLGRQPTNPTPLKSLARRAALVITEDFPAPPFPRWTQQLATQVDTAVRAVDCACIIPMRLVKRPFARAYAFRNHTQKEYKQRLAQTWEDDETVGEFFEGDCGFESIDLANADLAELCAQCEIDHTIPPVAHTPGGSTAGYARWEQFKRHGLKSYSRLRNDAAIVQPWKAKVQVIKAGQISDEKRVTERWVGIPAMNAIPAHLAAAIDTEFNVTVVSMAKNKGRWQLVDQHENDYGPFDAVIIAAPPPRATGLLKSSPKLLKRVANVEMQPCLAVMAGFEKPLDLPFDAAFVHESPVRWAARDNSKPRRPAADCWVFHANAKWSKSNAYAGKDDDKVVRSLTGTFFKSIGHTPVNPIYCSARHWRFAAAVNPFSVGCLWDAESKIGLCGDWCRMSRLEGAALSGMAMAGRILGMNVGITHSLQDWNG